MERFDAAIIGGGLLGCFAARNLMRRDINAVLIECADDVCTGISKANTAIVYTGYDNRIGSLKAKMTVDANAGFGALCEELSVPFKRCGSLMAACGENGSAVLRKKYGSALENKVPDVRLISGAEARELENGLSSAVVSALYAPTAGTVNPWSLCYAAFENAADNGCVMKLSTKLNDICRADGGYVLKTDRGEIFASAVINCAGLEADKVHEMLFEPDVRIIKNAADYLVFERGACELSHIIQFETENAGKGISLIPTVEGSILVGPTERELSTEASATDSLGLAQLLDEVETLFPPLRRERLIRSFAAVRPNPYASGVRSLGDFVIERPEPGFISFIGVKTPGLTCADRLGELAAQTISDYLGRKLRHDYNPLRSAAPRLSTLGFSERMDRISHEPECAKVVCFCEDVSEAEILDAIHRGARSIDGVKRRCGALMGVCQGSRCRYRIAQLLARECGGLTADYLGERGDGHEKC